MSSERQLPYRIKGSAYRHQSAEKYLKSYIIALELEFQKIHDLPVLLKSCLSRAPDLQVVSDDCKFLNRFYIDTRYPVHWPTNYTKEEALRAKNAAGRIRDTIRTALRSFHPSIS